MSPAPDGGYPGWNTAEGDDALLNHTTGGSNTAIGAHSLYEDSTGLGNTAVGAWPLALNISGNRNVAVGQGVLGNNTGSGNVGVGFIALNSNRGSGNSSQAFGFVALFNQQDGIFNNGFGRNTLYSNVTGDNNTAIGHDAGFDITGSGNIDIGSEVAGFAGENNTTRIRNIGTTPLNTGRFVHVDANGKLGYVVSSRRYKDNIKPMSKDSQALFALKPVTFHYKGDIDPSHAKVFGLIAEEVAEVNLDLVVRNAKGEVETIRFDSINAMLLNELLKEDRKLHDMEKIAAQQKKDFEAIVAGRQKQIQSLTSSLKDQTKQLQELDARLEASELKHQVVNNR